MAASRKMRLRSGFNFRSPAGWDALSSVYEISMFLTNRNKSWTHVIICDYLIGVQWLIRLPPLWLLLVYSLKTVLSIWSL
jgi:hypothetical protein